MTIQKHGYHVKNKLVALRFIDKFLFSFYDNFVSRKQRTYRSWKTCNINNTYEELARISRGETFVFLIVAVTFIMCI